MILWNPGLILNGGMVMLVVAFILALIACIWSWKNRDKIRTSKSADEFILTMLGELSLIFLLGIIIFMQAKGMVELPSYDERIIAYEEKNHAIEDELLEIIRAYKDYEQTISTESLSRANVVMAVSFFPGLAENEVVQKKIDVYLENEKEVERLEAVKMEVNDNRWLLCFGN